MIVYQKNLLIRSFYYTFIIITIIIDIKSKNIIGITFLFEFFFYLYRLGALYNHWIYVSKNNE